MIRLLLVLLFAAVAGFTAQLAQTAPARAGEAAWTTDLACAAAAAFEVAQAAELANQDDSHSCNSLDPDLDLDDAHLPCGCGARPRTWREPRLQALPHRRAPPHSVSVWRPPAA